MIPTSTKVYFATRPADLRKSFDGLAALAAATLGRDPARGGMFIFLNKRADQIRVLFRDPHGWCVLSKRLDTARFRRPAFDAASQCWETDAPALMRFLEDIEVVPASRARPNEKAPASFAPPHLSIVQPELQ